MAQQIINTGTAANDGTGDSLRVSFQKAAANFSELYALNARPTLTSNGTFYVSTSGNDANDGLSAGAPFLTVQKAVDTACNSISAAGIDTFIQLADGTYTQSSRITLPAQTGAGNNVYIQGNGTNASAVLINTSAAVQQVIACFSPNPVWWAIRNLKLESAHNASLLRASYGAKITWDNIVWGNSGSGVQLLASGGFLVGLGNDTITGSGLVHWYADTAGLITMASKTTTVIGSPNFPSGFAYSANAATISASSMTFNGTSTTTGPRYTALGNGIINTNGAGATYFPGNSGGSATTGGQYI